MLLKTILLVNVHLVVYERYAVTRYALCDSASSSKFQSSSLNHYTLTV